MSLFLVGGGYDDSLTEVYDEFVSQARHHNADAPIAVVVAGPASESADHAAELTRIVTSRWADANLLTIHLDGPGTAPTMGNPATPLWEENESFQLPDNLDTLAGIIVGGGAVPSYVNGLAPAAEQLSLLVRGGAPWLGFSAGAMAPCVTALAGGWKLGERQVGQQAGAEGFNDVTFVEGLGLVSLTVTTHNDTLSGDGLIISALESGLLSSAVAVDEATCLRIDASSGHTEVMGRGLVRWFTRAVNGVLVRSQHSAPPKPTPTPHRPRFEGLAKVAAATRAAHDKEEREKAARQRAEERHRAREQKDDAATASEEADSPAPTPSNPAAESVVESTTEDVKP
ncbi:cyanophycinase [Cutibacterium sp.]|uniref:cyanophycinase n=1 Tax=Cutibacterium sp. TaxID=1912221 RepID=UPI0026DCB144|nr:cyanophycinase [Cutibacterium sp.]MDO4412343.1 cyanophycinase [Cutibacterium sp.]